ncbi:LacI family transcriptional regulator [Salipiger sp. IMCC34102]|uniref:LacI family DNA-binding transcriptional regulator n=1 Tax=Salipiger sp. IMCC34102 TaxID=2510647 RepID=UPI00101D007E|nr:LacI family DNA-binding transcriptional regulator [Salipiger sp. IMCC34102]RYH02563.1 LacI family transcriptional regulator [Salipiger sp. IMCC34102]
MADGSQKPRGKVTIRHVAEDAGVSTAAVSKVMRNAYGVSDGLRAKVLKSIDTLGYRPSTAARGMRGRTYTIGVLLLEMSNPFLAQVVDGLQAALKDSGYKLLIGVGRSQATIERDLVDSMIDMQIDGVVLVAPRLSGEKLAPYARQIPLAVVGHHEPSSTAFDTVNSDDAAGARLAVEALVAKGHRDICMVSHPSLNPKTDVGATREAGYRRAMEDLGLGDMIRVWYNEGSTGRGDGPLEGVLDLSPRPTAAFVWSDLDGVDLLGAARKRGLRVPEDLALVSYDNNAMARLPMVDLSSVDQHGEEIGCRAAAALLSRLEGRREARHDVVTPHLVLRSSC